MSKKIFCSIGDYIKNKHETVYKLFETTCTTKALVGRGYNVALILPTADVIKKIEAGALSDDESKYNEATELLMNHVLVSEHPMKKVEDLAAGVSNRNHKVFVLKDNKVSADPGFKILKDRETSVAVFKADGPITSSAEEAPRIKSKRPVRIAEGAADEAPANTDTDKIRHKLVEFVEKSLSDNFKDTIVTYMKVVIYVLEELKKNNKDEYEKALLTVEASPVTSFYLIVEPYCAKKCFDIECLTDDCLEKIKETIAKPDGMVQYLKEGEKLVVDNVDEVVDDLRWSIEEKGLAKAAVTSAIKSAYSSNVNLLYKDGKSPFTPDEKEIQDVRRYHLNYMFTYVEYHLGKHEHSADSFKSTALNIMSTEQKFSDISAGLISQAELLAGPISFVNSGAFLYYPGAKKRVHGADDFIEGNEPHPAGVYASADAGSPMSIEEIQGACEFCGGKK